MFEFGNQNIYMVENFNAFLAVIGAPENSKVFSIKNCEVFVNFNHQTDLKSKLLI